MIILKNIRYEKFENNIIKWKSFYNKKNLYLLIIFL